jgi:hypothetical protein
MIGAALSVTKVQSTALADVLARFPGVATYHDFKTGRYYADNQTRGAAAELVDALPSGELTSAGLLVEPAATNLLNQSRMNTGTVGGRGTTPPTITSPVLFDGELCARATFDQNSDTLFAGSRLAQDGAANDATFTATTQTYSLYLGLDRGLVGSERIRYYWTGSDASPLIDITAVNSAQFVGKLVRLSVTATHAGSGPIYPVVYVHEPLSSELNVYVTKGQAEVGSVASSWIETTTSPVTRPAAGPILVQGLGSELLENGHFETDVAGWSEQTSALAAVDGEMVVTKNAGGNYGYANANVPVEVGKTYKIGVGSLRCGTCEQVRLALTDAIARNTGADNTISTSPIDVEYEGIATTTNLRLQFVVITSGTQAATAIVDTVSVKEVLPYPGFLTEDQLSAELGGAGEAGFIVGGSASETLSNDGNLTRTTEWFSVTPGSRLKLEALGGTASRRRVQTRSGGVISYQAGVSTNDSAPDGEIIVPAGAEQMRIYYFLDELGGGGGAADTATSLSAKRITNHRQVTAAIDVTNIPVDGTDRVVKAWVSSDPTSHVKLWREGATGLFRLESFVSGLAQGHVAVSGFDDGGEHSFICEIDYDTGRLSLNADGQGLEGPELVVNGTFDSNVDGWSLGTDWAYDAANQRIHRTGTTYHNALLTSTYSSLIAGLHYSMNVEKGGAAGVGYYTEQYEFGLLGTGANTFRFDHAGYPQRPLFYGSQPGGWIDNVSIRAQYSRDGVTMPSELLLAELGHGGGTEQLGGNISLFAAANGLHGEDWQ